ncbi:hypothetical protein PGT21_003447 [Puccinia graminis f. sp. tritici]|uniref:Uncharacterized protein n=1 Tax=Puccinia graminis f. sp. tritici TaxID=56615 RepID=A0A5B0LMJ2_PUCGR|nr:hypothetical protein PGT21_003447 [Puccinia graminis f. sp. tritici]KAA1079982.1 hypothetical protein PGTUg99_017810 [Puccinia graminis f. sp. tritici]
MIVSATFCPIIGLSEITSKKSPISPSSTWSRVYIVQSKNRKTSSQGGEHCLAPPQVLPLSAHRQIQTPRRSLFVLLRHP